MSRSTIGLDAENPEAVGNRPKKRNAGFVEKVEQDMSCSTNYKRKDIGQPFNAQKQPQGCVQGRPNERGMSDTPMPKESVYGSGDGFIPYAPPCCTEGRCQARESLP